jgi:hypothetical protein
MRLARKLILAVVLGMLLIIVARDYAAVRDDIRDYQQRIADDVATLGYGLSVTLDPDSLGGAGRSADRQARGRPSGANGGGVAAGPAHPHHPREGFFRAPVRLPGLHRRGAGS